MDFDPEAIREKYTFKQEASPEETDRKAIQSDWDSVGDAFRLSMGPPLKEGDHSRALCDKCKKIVTTTFRYADFSTKGRIFPNILQGFCDICGQSVCLPHQSVQDIKKSK